MNEHFLHFIWQYQFFNKTELKTTQQDTITILHPGLYNTDQGPDFSHARILMQGMEWHGNIEIHLKSSDWYLHKHQNDKNYDTIILHVVWENDRDVARLDQTEIPVLELKGKVDTALVDRYKIFINSGVHLPCQYYIHDIPEIQITGMFDKALIQRLQRKGSEILELYSKNNNDWEATFWQIFIQSFGFKINNNAFGQLSRSLPFKLLLKHAGKTVQLEALLFGQAGLLDGEAQDEYHALLKKEYKFLSHKYILETNKLEGHIWKFLRTRPCNFPTIRISQLAAVLTQSDQLINLIYENKTLEEYIDILKIPSSQYWTKHYKFGEKSNKDMPGITDNFIFHIIINALLPFKVARYINGIEESFPQDILQLLEKMPTEINKISKEWQKVGVEMRTAYDSQAGIELYNQYCLKRKCLYCNLGTYIIKH